MGQLVGHLAASLIERYLPLPKPVEWVLVFVGLLVVVVFLFSVARTTWKIRRILHRSLGRTVRRDEETSVKTWMALSGPELGAAVQDVTQKPSQLTRAADSTTDT